ncbi:MAG: hypothetical protein OXE02_01330 [Chloroflexi bacterium]|nr:hypothetical protein [Chloroflexota bacterium]
MNGLQLQVMERLAAMPLLDRIELAAVSGISERAAYDAAAALVGAGLASALPHASEIIPPTKRLMLSGDGLRHLARERDVPVGALLRTHPVSAQWRGILLQRLDAAAVVYRVTASIAAASGPVRDFRWFRASALDAALMLADGRTLGIVRQGPTLGRTAFAKRLLRLGDAGVPGALLVLASDPSRHAGACAHAAGQVLGAGLRRRGRPCGGSGRVSPRMAHAGQRSGDQPAGGALPGLAGWRVPRRGLASPRDDARSPHDQRRRGGCRGPPAARVPEGH